DAQLRLDPVGLAGDGVALLELAALDVQRHHAGAAAVPADGRGVAVLADLARVPVARDRARGDVRERQALDAEEVAPALGVVAGLEVLDAVAVPGHRHGGAAAQQLVHALDLVDLVHRG